MPRLSWSAVEERFYETGVDRGVLYVGEEPGVAWSGLISVSESPVGGEARPYYIDGVKYLNLSAAEEFAATINAFSSPSEFGPCDGTVSVQNGLFVTQQPRRSFGLSYRTRIGNAGDGPDHGYKIHLVYNALAAPSERPNNTIGETTEPINFSWAISTLPPTLNGYRPTAHFVIDSRKVPKNLLTTLEDILYGSDASAARLPTAQELIDLFASKGPMIRRNFASDPAATSIGNVPGKLRWDLINWWGDPPGAGNISLQTGPGPVPWVTTFVRRTFTAPLAGGDVGFSHGLFQNLGYPVTLGKTYTFSSYVRVNSTGKNSQMLVKGLDADHSEIYRLEGPWTSELPVDEWVRIAYTLTIPEGVSSITLWSNVASNQWVAGDTFDGTALLVEEGSILGPYFDGSMPDYEGVSIEWDGEPNNSSSSVRSWN